MPEDELPQPPEKPDPNDCCGGGCTPCIFEIYNEELAKYEIELLEWKRRQEELKNKGYKSDPA